MNAGLIAHRFVMRVALSGAGTFAWIFAFQFYADILESVPAAVIQTAFLYLIAQTCTALATPLSARMVRNGVVRGMMFGVLSAAAGFVSLGAAFSGVLEANTPYALVLFSICLGLYRAQYWVPYTVERDSAGFERDVLSVMEDFLVAGMPLIFGLALAAGFASSDWLLILSASLLIASLVPLSLVSEKYERFSWGYRETFGHLIEPRFQGIVWSSILDGAQSATLYFLWPLVVFLMLGSSYAAVGAVISLALMLAIPARMFAKAYARIWKFESPVVPMVIAGSVWLMRLAIATPIGIILVDALSVSTPKKTVSAAPVHDHAADGGSYIDELTALKEVGLAFGRIVMVSAVCALTLAFTLLQALAITFVLIAVFAMVSIWMQSQRDDLRV